MRYFSVMYLGLGISLQAVFVPQAHAVGTYEGPCHTQGERLQEAKKTLEKCIDQLEQASGEMTDAPRCLSELKEVNEKSKQLRECRSQNQ